MTENTEKKKTTAKTSKTSKTSKNTTKSTTAKTSKNTTKSTTAKTSKTSKTSTSAKTKTKSKKQNVELVEAAVSSVNEEEILDLKPEYIAEPVSLDINIPTKEIGEGVDIPTFLAEPESKDESEDTKTEKIKVPLYKRVQFWLDAVVVICIAIYLFVGRVTCNGDSANLFLKGLESQISALTFNQDSEGLPKTNLVVLEVMKRAVSNGWIIFKEDGDSCKISVEIQESDVDRIVELISEVYPDLNKTQYRIAEGLVRLLLHKLSTTSYLNIKDEISIQQEEVESIQEE